MFWEPDPDVERYVVDVVAASIPDERFGWLLLYVLVSEFCIY